ncbi:LysR family transcriptional regulator [Pseudoalteromonas sp. A25]|uniref:LysR family transcriptional regulator n=1 Tax=Pseudoalteromonas sp. A25 TaxID=116092 RepID=UPI0012613293|nr:LysR family transcriptional regulator [Pseudoalteromonas sp. A25]BBN83105.1 LysR family transcriptional regulator [Pseudoalteromonas sp. A25]
MIEKVELPWLLSFLSVYNKLSFKQAACDLQLPTSNVSRHVALLEEQLAVRLFERTTRKMVATEAGIRLYDAVAPLLQTLNDSLNLVSKQGQTLSGPLKLIMPDLPFLAQCIADFCAEHPLLELRCDTQLVPSQGLLDGFDLVLSFARGALPDSNWVAKELARWPSVIVASPALLANHPAPDNLAALSQSPCITTFTALQGMPWKFKQKRTVHVHSSFKVNSGHMAKAAALRGLGFAILPLHTCHTQLKNGQLQRINLELEPEDLVLYAYYSGRHYPQFKIQALITHLCKQFEKNVL